MIAKLPPKKNHQNIQTKTKAKQKQIKTKIPLSKPYLTQMPQSKPYNQPIRNRESKNVNETLMKDISIFFKKNTEYIRKQIESQRLYTPRKNVQRKSTQRNSITPIN